MICVDKLITLLTVFNMKEFSDSGLNKEFLKAYIDGVEIPSSDVVIRKGQSVGPSEMIFDWENQQYVEPTMPPEFKRWIEDTIGVPPEMLGPAVTYKEPHAPPIVIGEPRVGISFAQLIAAQEQFKNIVSVVMTEEDLFVLNQEAEIGIVAAMVQLSIAKETAITYHTDLSKILSCFSAMSRNGNSITLDYRTRMSLLQPAEMFDLPVRITSYRETSIFDFNHNKRTAFRGKSKPENFFKKLMREKNKK